MAPGPIDNATGCLECTPRTDRDALAEGTVTKETIIAAEHDVAPV